MKDLNIYIETSYKKLLEISKTITSNRHPDYEDLLHESLLAILNGNQKKIKLIIDQKKLTFYIVRIMINLYHSKTSPFHKKYRKQYKDKQLKEFYIYTKEPLTKEKKLLLEQQEQRLKWIDEKLKNLSWFDVQVFKLYYKKNFSLNSMQKATKINKNTLGRSIRFVKNYLINERKD